MKIGIDMGHTLSGADYGAVGIEVESVLTREVGNKVIKKLQNLGHNVVNCTVDYASSVGHSLQERVQRANNNNVDLFISIHFNCFNGHAFGSEVWTYGGKAFNEASNVLYELGHLFKIRDIKDGSKLYVIKNTKMKAMVIECCFCDNEGDMRIYNSEYIANAIVRGLTGQAIPVAQKNVLRKTYRNGDKVKIAGTHYATGEKIPAWVKRTEHTIMQVKNDRVLLKEIYSWVYKKDIIK